MSAKDASKSKHKVSKQERKAVEARLCSENMRHLIIGYRAIMEDKLRDEGLTLPQLRLLKAVRQQADVSAATLARACQVTPQTLQAVLRRAVQAKWIIRGKSKKSERIVTAKLTPLGDSLLQQGNDMATRIEQRIWQDVGWSDLVQLNETLQAGIASLAAEVESANG